MKSQSLTRAVVLFTLCLGFWGRAHAQFAVIDVGAIAQLVQQVQQIEQEIRLAETTLKQTQQTYAAITGSRGMQQLLSGTNRNYLPTTWAQLQMAVSGSGGVYGGLASDITATVNRNAVLTPATLAGMDPQVVANLDARRRSVALHEALARQALATTSDRFTSLQQLINAIPTAADEKAVLDLQARIAVEQTMLLNESIKLDQLHQAAQVSAQTERIRSDELALASIGSLATLPPMGLK